MKIVVTGDWHIRIKPEIPEAWQLARYRQLTKEIIDLCHRHEATLFLSGDIADRNKPNLCEMKLLLELFTALSAENIDTWLISGNHEAIGQKESTFDYFVPLFRKLNGHGKGQIHYDSDNRMIAVFPRARVEVAFVGHPALSEGPLTRFADGYTNILISHFRPDVNAFIKEEIDVAKFIAPFDFVFASDIHMPLQQDHLVFTNHPLNSSFEAKPDCGCLLVTCEDGAVSWERVTLDLPNLIQISTTADKYRELPSSKDYYRVQITGTPEELREIRNDQPHVQLLKVPEVTETYVEASEAEEIRDLALDEALEEYMQQLGFTQEKIARMMEVFREP